jgi:hypothetical protein
LWPATRRMYEELYAQKRPEFVIKPRRGRDPLMARRYRQST